MRIGSLIVTFFVEGMTFFSEEQPTGFDRLFKSVFAPCRINIVKDSLFIFNYSNECCICLILSEFLHSLKPNLSSYSSFISDGQLIIKRKLEDKASTLRDTRESSILQFVQPKRLAVPSLVQQVQQPPLYEVQEVLSLYNHVWFQDDGDSHQNLQARKFLAP